MVPPCAMIPSVLWRSRMTWSPGGSRPSKPSRNPTTSHPSFSAARTTPRRTAFNPGQSPPLVSTPIRGLFICAGARSESLLGIQHSATGRPLIVKLPATLEELRPLDKAVAAPKHDDNQVPRNHGRPSLFLHDLGFALRRENQAVSGASCPSGLHPVNAVRAEQFICIAEQITFFLGATAKGNLPLLLRDIKAERGLVHGVTG